MEVARLPGPVAVLEVFVADVELEGVAGRLRRHVAEQEPRALALAAQTDQFQARHVVLDDDQRPGPSVIDVYSFSFVNKREPVGEE